MSVRRSETTPHVAPQSLVQPRVHRFSGVEHAIEELNRELLETRDSGGFGTAEEVRRRSSKKSISMYISGKVVNERKRLRLHARDPYIVLTLFAKFQPL